MILYKAIGKLDMKKPNNKIIKLGKMTKEKVCKFDTEIDVKTFNVLLKYAKKAIMKDNETLISWAINDILKKQIEKDRLM